MAGRFRPGFRLEGSVRAAPAARPGRPPRRRPTDAPTDQRVVILRTRRPRAAYLPDDVDRLALRFVVSPHRDLGEQSEQEALPPEDDEQRRQEQEGRLD